MRTSFHVAVCCLVMSLTGCAEDAPMVTENADGIIDGVTSDKGAHPETVYLWLGGGSCSGTLIAPTVVLTARHCVEDVPLSELQAFFGENANEEGTWIAAASYEFHPSADIGAITLSRPGPVAPVPFRRQPLTPQDVGRDLTLVGFGDAGIRGNAGIKREGVTQLDDLAGDILYVGSTGSKTCFGDSGGPTFVTVNGQKYVAGVASFVTSDNCDIGASGNVRTSSYVDWIEDYVARSAAASCDADSQCAEGCGDVADPDCPCAADGVCSLNCDSYLLNDTDCADCGQNGVCGNNCPELDLDCCDADSICNRSCVQPDPDCAYLGDSCSNSAQCFTDLCGSTGEESRCSQACDSANPCPDGFDCLDGGGCWPASGGGCSSTPGKGGDGPLLALLFALLFIASSTLRPRPR